MSEISGGNKFSIAGGSVIQQRFKQQSRYMEGRRLETYRSSYRVIYPCQTEVDYEYGFEEIVGETC
jgi:hypothetical protein